jgi:hypothetical protein
MPAFATMVGAPFILPESKAMKVIVQLTEAGIDPNYYHTVMQAQNKQTPMRLTR